jgi:hypothetical protein
MRCAETGFNLEVDLGTGRIEKGATDVRDTELYLGGRGWRPGSCSTGCRTRPTRSRPTTC